MKGKKQDGDYIIEHYPQVVKNLYFEPKDGEISLVYHEGQLIMVTAIDISSLFKEKRKKAYDYVQKLLKIKNDNLVEIYKFWYVPDQIIFIEMEPPILSTLGKGDQINWKNFTK